MSYVSKIIPKPLCNHLLQPSTINREKRKLKKKASTPSSQLIPTTSIIHQPNHLHDNLLTASSSQGKGCQWSPYMKKQTLPHPWTHPFKIVINVGIWFRLTFQCVLKHDCFVKCREKKERKKACLSYCPDSCSGLEKTQRSLKNDTQWLLITNGRKSDRVIPGFGLVLYYPPTATTCFEVHLTA